MSTTKDRSSAPAYEVTIGGKQYVQNAQDGMQRVEVHDHVDMVTMLVCELGGTETQPEWGFKIGDPVEVKLGKGTAPIFKGEVTALEPGY
jgi:hypothetical protein